MIPLLPYQRIRLYLPLNEVKNGKVIGVQQQKDHSITYTIEPLSVRLHSMRSGRIIKLNSKDVDSGLIIIEVIKLNH